MNTIIHWIHAFFDVRNYTLRNFTAFLLVLFCIQYIPVESRDGVSWVKVLTMAITAGVLLKHLIFNKALAIALTYFCWILFTAFLLHGETFRASTVIYLFMFVTTFTAFYTFVWSYHVFDIDFFIDLIRKFIFVLVGVLVAQQLCLMAGIRLMPILNLCQILGRGIGANSLTFEPSTFGRLISVLLYAYLKCNEYRQGSKVSLKQMFSTEHRMVMIAYLWAVLTMGSGTAFVAMAVVSLYFTKGWSILYTAPLFFIAYIAMDHFGNESFQRVQNATEAVMTLDGKKIVSTDTSAAVRILPMVNTLSIDLSNPNIWTGYGCDSGRHRGLNMFSDEVYLGNIGDYGLIGFIICIILTFSCAVSFFSIPTLMMLCGVAPFAGGNISYIWGLLMIFTCVTYFKHQRDLGILYVEEYEDEETDEDEEYEIEEQAESTEHPNKEAYE